MICYFGLPNITKNHQLPMPNHKSPVIRLLLCLGCLILSSCAGSKALTSSSDVFTIGSATVQVEMYASGDRAFTLFNMHDDENTAVEAGREVIRKEGGQLVTLSHSGERLIAFELNGRSYRFDPNRMFTDAGARRTLEREENFTEEALQAVRTFADQILARYELSRGGGIVTVHNNTDQNYMITDYAAGGDYESDAEAAHIEPGTDPDDFFYVTDRRFFEAARDAGYNVILQDNAQATDDGSLSVFSGREGIPYINVEAQHGHVEMQVRMLEWVSRLFP